MLKKFWISFCIIFLAGNFIGVMSKIGEMSSGPYVYKWTMPFEVIMFLLAGMIPAYFAGKESK